MLDAKKAALDRKEDQILKLRNHVTSVREQDAQVIQDLRNELAQAGNSTLSDLHKIVSKQSVGNHNVGGRVAN